MADPVTLKPVNFTDGSGPTESYKPVVTCPEMWGESILGYNLSGKSTPGTADSARKAEGEPKDVPGTVK